MLASVKDMLRISDSSSNLEVQDLIDGAKADLALSGVHSSQLDESDPLIKRAIALYCKAHFGYDDMGERFEQSYLSLKNHLTLSIEYTAKAVGDEDEA